MSKNINESEQNLEVEQTGQVIETINQPVQPVIISQGNYRQQYVVNNQVPLANNIPQLIQINNQIQGNFILVKDPIQELEYAKRAYIKQDSVLCEFIIGCTQKKTYHVFLDTPEGEKYMFKILEESDCLSRNILCFNCREFHLDFFQIGPINPGNVPYLQLMKPGKCFANPKIDVKHIDSGTFFGRIQKKGMQLDPQVDVFDEQNKIKYSVKTEFCQCGIFCCCCGCCAKLSDIEFKILQDGKIKGNVCKLSADISEFLTKADTYQIIFPKEANSKDKMLLLVSTILIDYVIFDKAGIGCRGGICLLAFS